MPHSYPHRRLTQVMFAILLMMVIGNPAKAQNGPLMPLTLAEGMLARFQESAAKLELLAESLPPEKYSWRPGEGVRSVSEVFVHVAMGNYYTTKDVGVKIPGDIPENAEQTITRKDEVVSFLKRSNAHLASALKELKDADLSKQTTMFGQQTTYGNVYLFGIGHVNEHLGQLIAYARTNNVVPEWTGQN